MSATVGIAAAYERCERITRTEAANFYYGIRLLPRGRRQAMSAVYAFARRVDDIGDGTLPADEKLRRLDAEARALEAIEARRAPLEAIQPAGAPLEAIERGAAPLASDPVMVALADAYARFPLPAGALGELVEGVRMDVDGITYESFDELVLYYRRVAGTIGRMCLAIFGLPADAAGAAHAEALADDLGVALQLTNILRDVREDAENGRVYLPGEDLRRFELQDRNTPAAIAALARAAGSAERPGELERMAALVRFEAERAREWFQRGIALAALLDRRSSACVLAMAGIYRRLLDRIELDPERSLARRMSLPAHEKAWVATRGMLGGGV